jgi:hypothetical protein
LPRRLEVAGYFVSVDVLLGQPVQRLLVVEQRQGRLEQAE